MHIFNKREVGRRLAAAGLHHIYNLTDVTAAGPQVSAVTAASAGVEVSFTGAGDGLDVRPPYLGFEVEVAGVWTAANISSHTTDTVTLTAPPGSTVSAVRYAFKDKPCPNLGCAIYGPTGLPSTPFTRNVTHL